MRSQDDFEHERGDDEGRRHEEEDRLDRDHLRRLKRDRQGRAVKAIFVLAVLAIFIVFILGNSDKEKIDFVFVESEISLIWVMLGCLVVGLILGFFLGRPGKQLSFHRDRDRDRDRDR